MHELTLIDLDALMREIACYLAAVDAFRAESREPTWLPELVGRSETGLGASGTHCA